MSPVDLDEQGRRVRAARAYLGANADELSKAVGIGKSTLLKIERGQREAKHWELWAIAEVCGVPREFFESEELSVASLEDEAAALERDEETAARKSEPIAGQSAREANGSSK